MRLSDRGYVQVFATVLMDVIDSVCMSAALMLEALRPGVVLPEEPEVVPPEVEPELVDPGVLLPGEVVPDPAPLPLVAPVELLPDPDDSVEPGIDPMLLTRPVTSTFWLTWLARFTELVSVRSRYSFSLSRSRSWSLSRPAADAPVEPWLPALVDPDPGVVLDPGVALEPAVVDPAPLWPADPAMPFTSTSVSLYDAMPVLPGVVVLAAVAGFTHPVAVMVCICPCVAPGVVVCGCELEVPVLWLDATDAPATINAPHVAYMYRLMLSAS